MSAIDISRIGQSLSTLAAVLGLPSCSLDCPPAGFEQAAYHPSDMNRSKDGLWLASDRWVRNPGAEAFLRDSLRADGLTSLATKYGMQCARQSSNGCTDCYVCSKAFPGKALGADPVFPALRCVDYGEMFVRAEIGPGEGVVAMTYWQLPAKPKP